MFDKINVLKIVIRHISTLKDYRTKKYKISDFILFFGMPSFFAFLLIFLNIFLIRNVISVLTISLSIFVLILFNLLFLIYNVAQKSKNILKIKFLTEIYSNISFCILVGILAVDILFFVAIIDNISGISIVYKMFNFIAYYLTILFFFTLLMVLKRIYILLYQELKG